MTARKRTTLVVVAIALGVGGAVAGITAASSEETTGVASKGPVLRAGNPPLSLDLGVRVDREARDLREGLRLYAAGRKVEAGAQFARHGSLEARIGQAVSTASYIGLPSLRS